MNEKSVVSPDSKSALNDKKLFIETYGCQMNVADSEVVASIMEMDGFELTENIGEANAVFVNTCSVRDNAEQKVIHRLQQLNAMKKKNKGMIVGVIGCMAERVKDELITDHKVDVVVGPDAYLDIPNLINSVEQGEKAINVELSKTETYKDVLPHVLVSLFPVLFPLCVAAISFVLIALCLIPAAANAAGKWKVF